MKKSMWKRIAALLMAGAMMFSIAACGDNGGSSEGGATSADGKVFAEPTEISITVNSHATWPHRDDWKLWQYMSEATGATLKLTSIPQEDYNTKVNLMLSAPETLPDLLHFAMKQIVDNTANQGALVAFEDYEDIMPDYKAFMESLPEATRENLLAQRRSADGKIYSAPAYGTEIVSSVRAWLYRKDIFEKHNLKVPETYDEVYEVAKQLKALYPESFPVCFRQGFTGIRNMGAQWKPYQSFDIYYDFDNEEWRFGAFEDTTRDMVAWLAKMVKEGLCPPDIVDISTKGWEELMMSDRGFITLDYIVRLDHFNLLMAEANPEYELAFMAPPAGNELGLHKMTNCTVDASGYTVCNTGKEKNIENAFKLINWMYTDEAEELLSWGKEGETFFVNENGRRQYILNTADDTPRGLYGVGSYGLYQRMNPDAYAASYTEKQVAAAKEAAQYQEPYVNPMWWMSFTDEESDRRADLDLELGNYAKEWIGKFISGQEPIEKWDEYVEGSKAFNAEEYIEIYKTAYDRVTK
ncbi:MAG: extracellular solute-binding protein [Clostridia bacterium]|nr:extracellular solute-binding protein [Clostridia bacterium]